MYPKEEIKNNKIQSKEERIVQGVLPRKRNEQKQKERESFLSKEERILGMVLPAKRNEQ